MVIGSGVYYLGSYVLERTGLSMGWSLVAWIVGGFITIVGGLCFAELGSKYARCRRADRLSQQSLQPGFWIYQWVFLLSADGLRRRGGPWQWRQ